MKPTNLPWQNLPLNEAPPLTMHIDMNSCYATMEQQANPLLRGRPVAVCAYAAYWGAVISPSIEAKAKGIKVGTRVADALNICPDLFVIQMHPPLYLDAHMRFKRIFTEYSPMVWPKSVDEAVLLFSQNQLQDRTMEAIGLEIKARIRDEIGEWVRVNVGIAPNQFLAKLAAGFNKPDGLTNLDSNNLREVFAGLDLLDLPGINVRNKSRLWLAGIHTPLEFLDAPMYMLKHQVFQAITGYYWYLRLRGYEVDGTVFRRRSYSNNNTLQIRTNDWETLQKFVMKLCEKTGRRLRKGGWVARRMHVWLVYEGHSWWHVGLKTTTGLYTTGQLYFYAMKLFNMQPRKDLKPTHIGIDVSELQPVEPRQQGLFDDIHGDYMALSKSLDTVNDRYGDLVIGSALLEGMDNFILNRIAYGSIKDIQDLYDTP